VLAEESPRRNRPGRVHVSPDRPRLVSVPLNGGNQTEVNAPGTRLVSGLIHASGSRLRLRIHAEPACQRQLRQVLESQPEIAQVRINALACSCVLQFRDGVATPDSPQAFEQWLNQLPVDLEASASLSPKPGQRPATAAESDAGNDDEDEGFVPSRVILPVSSLALALLAGPLALPPLAVAGFILVSAHLSFKRAWAGLKQERKINVDFLDALAVTLHSLEGFLVGPALMISMIEGGEAVRDATQRIAHSANTDLLASLQADVRRLRSDGSEEVVPSTELVAGDRVLFFPGDSIPIDGVIESGEGSFDVVKLTGESVPRHAVAGDEVLAGFILLEGSLVVEIRAVGGETRIGQITAMIESAPVYDTRVGNFAAKIANRFVMPTLLLAGVSLVLSAGNVAQAASLLMFDLGTGLRVSVPTAIMAALTRAGSQGLLIRSGRALEQLVDIDVVVFDKTGTLTQGHPSVVHVDVLHSELQLERLSWLATTAEQGLNHPVATAIVQYAEAQGLQPGSCDSWDYRIGKGVSAVIEGQAVLIGNAKILRDESLEVPDLHPEQALRSSTPIYLAVDGVVAAVFYAADQLRPDSRDLVAELHRRGIQAHMLTGDVASVANAVAAELGLQPDEVHAEALPDQKAELVKQLSEQGHKVAFVGDGINDSAALAYADVSISFASGSDLARETADIVLTNDKVSGLITAQDLARRTFALVKQNISIVGVPNLSALVIGTFVPVSPIAAVLLNNGSCLVAAANALRTLGFTPTPLPPATAAKAVVDATAVVDAESVVDAEAVVDTKPVVEAKTVVDIKVIGSKQRGTKPVPAPEQAETLNLTTQALAKRLGTSHQTISARRRRGDLADWSRSLDPEGKSWTQAAAGGHYVTIGA
jgi:heavy metal translocating P-type ATPase